METLPLLEQGMSLQRSVDEVTRRMLSIHAAGAMAHGMERSETISWLEREGLTDALTDHESRYVLRGSGDSLRFIVQVEGLWALAWAMSMVDVLDFSRDCADDFVRMLPDLTKAEPSAGFRAGLRPRPIEDVVAAYDLAYCLHWAVRESRLSDQWRAGNLQPYVVIERRRALEWLLCTDDWDETPMDT